MAKVQENGADAITGINVTPMVDITLVLLIIFMATAHLIVHRAVNLNVPKVANSETLPTQSIQIQMEADKSLSLNGRKLSLQELTVNLSQMAKLSSNIKITLTADEHVSWGDVASIIDVIRGAGVTKIATEVQPKKGPL